MAAVAGYLNQVVRFEIDGGRGFVEDEHFGLAQQGARQANQLALADAQVLAALRSLVFQTGRQRLDEGLQVRVLQRRPHLIVRVLVERVQVHAQRPRE